MTAKILLMMLGCLVALSSSATGEDASRDDASRQAHIEAAATAVDVLLAPLKQQSLREGRGGRISPFDLPTEPDGWRSSGKQEDEPLLMHIRFLLQAAVCSGDGTALRKIHEIDWLLYGLGFSETEALFLQRRSDLKQIDLPFHDRYRKLRNYSANMSEAPQVSMQLNAAFNKDDITGALDLVPNFREVCQSYATERP